AGLQVAAEIKTLLSVLGDGGRGGVRPRRRECVAHRTIGSDELAGEGGALPVKFGWRAMRLTSGVDTTPARGGGRCRPRRRGTSWVSDWAPVSLFPRRCAGRSTG